MRDRFYYYCKIFKTTPKKMRVLLRRYYYFPSDIRRELFEEYSAGQNGCLFNGRLPRSIIAICTEFKLSKPDFEKLLEIHESGLFNLIKKSTQEE